jgi:predicted transcriptional regulator
MTDPANARRPRGQKPNDAVRASRLAMPLESAEIAAVRSATAMRWKILAFLRATPATCDEVEERMALRHQTASARVHELARAGLIEPDGERRTRSGRRATVWKAAVLP